MSPRSCRSAARRGSAVARTSRRAAVRVRTGDPAYRGHLQDPHRSGVQLPLSWRPSLLSGAPTRTSTAPVTPLRPDLRSTPRTSARCAWCRRRPAPRARAARPQHRRARRRSTCPGSPARSISRSSCASSTTASGRSSGGCRGTRRQKWLPFLVLVTVLVFWRGGLYAPREQRGGAGPRRVVAAARDRDHARVRGRHRLPAHDVRPLRRRRSCSRAIVIGAAPLELRGRDARRLARRRRAAPRGARRRGRAARRRSAARSVSAAAGSTTSSSASSRPTARSPACRCSARSPTCRACCGAAARTS